MTPDFPCHPSIARMLEQFTMGHLTDPEWQRLSQMYCSLAVELARLVPYSADTTHALRSLMSAKDDGVRALIFANKPDADAAD